MKTSGREQQYNQRLSIAEAFVALDNNEVIRLNNVQTQALKREITSFFLYPVDHEGTVNNIDTTQKNDVRIIAGSCSRAVKMIRCASALANYDVEVMNGDGLLLLAEIVKDPRFKWEKFELVAPYLFKSERLLTEIYHTLRKSNLLPNLLNDAPAIPADLWSESFRVLQMAFPFDLTHEKEVYMSFFERHKEEFMKPRKEIKDYGPSFPCIYFWEKLKDFSSLADGSEQYSKMIITVGEESPELLFAFMQIAIKRKML